MAVGDRAVVEAIIRVRDEATKEFAAITKNLGGQAKTVETAFASASQAGVGDLAAQIADMGSSLERLAAPTAGAATGLGGLLGMLGGPAGIAGLAGVATTAIGAYAYALEQAAQEQAKFNRALEGFSPAPFVAGVEQANDRLALMVERSKSFLGTLREVASELGRGLSRLVGAGGQTPEEVAAENQAAARVRTQLAAQQDLRRAQAEQLRLEEQAARRAGQEDVALDKARQRLEIEKLILNARQQQEESALIKVGIPDEVRARHAVERAALTQRFDEEQAQRADRLAREEEQRLAKQITANEQAAREIARAWEQSLAARERAALALAGAQRSLEEAQRARFRETVSGLPGLQAEQQRIAGLPGASGLQHAEMAAELASLQQEAAAIQKEDRRRAIEDRERFAQERVDQLSADFAKADASAEKLTARVKELNAELKNIQVSPGFAAKLSQDLADTLQFLSARSP